MKPEIKEDMSKLFATLDDGRRIALFYPTRYEARFIEALEKNVHVTLEEKRKLTFEAGLRATAAMLAAKDVPQEVQDERLATCKGCPFYRKDKETGDFFCKQCGCNLAGNGLGRIVNMVRKVERLVGGWPTWGCKFPGRAEGKGGWKR